MNIIVLRNKRLTLTQHSTIYQGENRADNLRFLININDLCEFNIAQTICYLFVMLPSGEIGKLTVLDFSSELYKDEFLCAQIPITKTITKDSGKLKIWLTFSYVDDELFTHYSTTNMIELNIDPSQAEGGFIDPDESVDIFAELESKIKEINNSKVANIDILEGSIIMYSDNERLHKIGEIALPSDIEWKEWNEE